MTIPKHAKKVFKGELHEIYQWEQERFDGSTATWEVSTRPDSTQVLAVKDGKLLMAEEEQPNLKPFYGFFGGRLEGKEKPLENAKRELLEEAGLVSDDWELYKEYPLPGKTRFTLYFYIARNCKKVQEQDLEVGERIDVMELTLKEFYETLASGKVRAVDIAIDLLGKKYLGEEAEFEQKLGLQESI